jgi:uncharacterized protein YndB with AHSA1/START domain
MTTKNDPTTQAIPGNLLLTCVFDAPRALVFKAWTDPGHLAHWWGPHGFTTTIQEMDLRPGGRWDHVMHGPDGADYPNYSTFIEVVKPEHLTPTEDTGKAAVPKRNLSRHGLSRRSSPASRG